MKLLLNNKYNSNRVKYKMGFPYQFRMGFPYQFRAIGWDNFGHTYMARFIRSETILIGAF